MEVFVCTSCLEVFQYYRDTCPKCKAKRAIVNKSSVNIPDTAKAQLLEEKNQMILEQELSRFRSTKNGCEFHILGARGRTIDVYPNKCVITTDVTLGSVMTSNATDGEKTIFFCDCVGIQFKRPGLTLGYLQFETSASVQNNISSNFFNENTFTYNESDIPKVAMDAIVQYVKDHVEAIKSRSNFSPADELLKYKSLLDSGVINEEEFEAKKKQLLAL